jgi:hypothetical protein
MFLRRRRLLGLLLAKPTLAFSQSPSSLLFSPIFVTVENSNAMLLACNPRANVLVLVCPSEAALAVLLALLELSLVPPTIGPDFDSFTFN